MIWMVLLFLVSITIAGLCAYLMRGVTYKGEDTSYFVFLGYFILLGVSLPWVLAVDAGIFIPLIFFIF